MTELAANPALPRPPDPLRQVIGWIVGGHDEATIREALEVTFPGEKPQPLIVKAMKEISKSGEPDPRVVRGWAIEATRELYRLARETGDLVTALRAAKQLVELSR